MATLDVKISIFRYQRCDILSDSTLSISNIWAKIGQSQICFAFGCFFDFDGNFGVDFDSFRSIDWYEVTQWIIICWTVSWIFSGQTRILLILILLRFGLILPWYVYYYQDIPSLNSTQFLGLRVSGKFMTYFLGLQVVLGSVTSNSVVAVSALVSNNSIKKVPKNRAQLTFFIWFFRYPRF